MNRGIRGVLLLILITPLSWAWTEKLEYARELNFSNYVSMGEVIKGPPGTWIELLNFKVGGILKNESKFCMFYKVPLLNKKGSFSLTSNKKENCEWSPKEKVLVSEDEVEFLQLSIKDQHLKIKYLRKNRTKDISVKLYNNYNIFPGVILIPEGRSLKIDKASSIKPLCGKRNNPACVRKFSSKRRDRCLDLDQYYFCNPGTSLSCRGQSVFCL